MSANGSEVATVNGRLIGLASSFLELTDTPVAFTGHARKRASVNPPENALEFTEAPFAPIPVFPDTALYNAWKTVNWEDLDVGVGRCLALIKFTCANPVVALFRQRGETKDTDSSYGTQGSQNDVGGHASYVWVPTDANGFVEWRVTVANNIVLTLEGYISMPTLCNNLMYDGVGGFAWAHLDPGLGGGYHWPFIRAWNKDTSVAAANVWLRPGYSAPDWTYGMATLSGIGIDDFRYAFVPTNWNGVMDAKDTGGGAKDLTIHSIADVINLNRVNADVFNGVTTTAWQRLDLPVGKSFVLLRIYADALQPAGNMRFRKAGEALDVGTRGGPHTVWAMTFNTDRWAYIWMVTNGYGQVDFITSVAVNIKIMLEAHT